MKRGFLQTPEGVRAYLDWFGADFASLDEWYGSTYRDVEQRYGSGLWQGKNALCTKHPLSWVSIAYPDHDWKPWRFKNTPDGWWDDEDNQKKWFATLPSDRLDSLTNDEIIAAGGRHLLKHFGESSRLLVSHFRKEMLPWDFPSVPKGFWNDQKNVRWFFEWLGPRLNVRSLDDWYKVGQEAVVNNGGGTLIQRFCSLHDLFCHAYPEHEWDETQWGGNKQTQALMFEMLLKHYPDAVWEYRDDSLRFSNGYRMELDVFVPSERLAFEYQGRQHYMSVEAWGGEETLERRIERDAEKRSLCSSHGIRLVEVPFTWDRAESSLLSLTRRAS